MAGERVAVGCEGSVQLGPVGVAEGAARGRQDLGFFQRHVVEVGARVALGGFLESLSARLAQHLEGQQRVLQLAYGALALRMVEEGKPAPAFSLTSDTGDTVTLEGLRGKPVVLYFYPKDDTPATITQ